MRIESILPDTAGTLPLFGSATDQAATWFRSAYDAVAQSLEHAQAAQRDFATGQGSLLAMTTSQATADVALSTAVAIASRVSQLASTLGNMSL